MKNYYLTIDTETANNMDYPLFYDIGGAIHDKKGNVEETFSFVCTEIFRKCSDLMKTAYYAEKIPEYITDLKSGKRTEKTLYQIKVYINDLCKKYNVKAIIAHNARFDYKAVNTTERYVTSSKYRYFLPYGIPIWDTLTMAQQTVGKQKSYISWCKEYGYMRSKNCPRLTAEILYRYMTGNYDFKEEHKGLDDVMIEKEIFSWCMRQHKAMRKSPWKE